MSKKPKKEFKTFDFILLLSIFMAVGGISGSILNSHLVQFKVTKAQLGLEEIAQAVLRPRHPKSRKFFKNRASEKSGRSLASLSSEPTGQSHDLGGLGKDPWGKEYRYRFIRNKKGMPIYLAVWSPGPNGVNDTAQSAWSVEGKQQFSRDDVGQVFPIR